jgi:hypothetical protein
LVRAGAAVGEPIEFEVINLPTHLIAQFGVDSKAALMHTSCGLARGTLLETEMGGLVLCAEPRDDIERGCVALAEVAQLNCRSRRISAPHCVDSTRRQFRCAPQNAMCDCDLCALARHWSPLMRARCRKRCRRCTLSVC